MRVPAMPAAIITMPMPPLPVAQSAELALRRDSHAPSSVINDRYPMMVQVAALT